MIGSYPEVQALGHRELAQLFDTPTIVEEKVDGSQLSFSLDMDGKYHMRSKGQDQTDARAKMFDRAWEVVTKLPLMPTWIYRGEYLNKPKHNTLAYDRVPTNNIVIFDIQVPGDGVESVDIFLSPFAKAIEAERIGLESVPLLHETFKPVTADSAMDTIEQWLQRDSFLGGQKIEGVVIKNYERFGSDHKALMGKFVSEAFKEKHGTDWKNRNPGQGDLVHVLAATYCTEARWRKAIQHLKEQELLQNAPQDIGPLIKEINLDVLKECADEIKEELFKRAWKDISRGITAGFPEWYKHQLAGEQEFADGTAEADQV